MTVTINGTSGFTFADSSTLPSATFSPVFPITASVATNALTVTLNACALVFRSTPLTSGATTTLTVASPISVVVPASATLGTVNATQSRIVVIALNNAGTVELAVVNISGGNNLDETTLISTTAISSGSTSASTIYSTSARTSVPFRVVGYVESTQTTAGTWATAPSTIQGYGGQALAAMSSLGYGQTWQDVTASRTAGTTYTNTTGKPITAIITVNNNASFQTDYTVTVAGVVLLRSYVLTAGQQTSAYMPSTVIVPPNTTYLLTITTGTLYKWTELR